MYQMVKSHSVKREHFRIPEENKGSKVQTTQNFEQRFGI